MTEPSATPDPAAPQNTFTNSGPNYGAQGTFYGSVQVNNHGTQVNLHALLHDHTGFMQDRLTSFVGRADELAEVQRRIAELLPTGGYITITGQAGQGKSSLIAKLVELALRERVGEDLPIAQLVERAGPGALAYHFIPFSPGPDHQVGLLRNLMTRLIGKYGLSDLYVATDSRPALRDYFARVLIEVAARGGQEVIYLDGLDQIEEDASGVRDLSFLPTNPPAGIVFVLGTRPNDTLRPLELRKPQQQYWLPPLSRADFALILQHRGVTLNIHLADRFYSVMEANALYLDLVARELAEAGALPAEQIIAQVADNPDNLFSLTLDRLKRPPLAWREVIKPVLGLMLAAREPLRLRAIRTLISQPDDAVQEGLERLGGLLQRDGEGRFTLFHLKLRDYLREDTAQPGRRYVFAADEEEQWHERLAVWADEGGGLAAIWQDKVGNVLEQDRRAYTRQHYVTHLCLAKNWPRLWEVLDAGEYAAAKLRHDPSTRSVVLDLDLVRRQMTAAMQGDYEAGVEWLPRLWRYSLLRGSLASQADNYPDGLIPLLVELGQVWQAIYLTDTITDNKRKLDTLYEIKNVLYEQGGIIDEKTAIIHVEEMIYLTMERMKNLGQSTECKDSIEVQHQLKMNASVSEKSAIEINTDINKARSIKNIYNRACALLEIALNLEKPEMLEVITEVAEIIMSIAGKIRSRDRLGFTDTTVKMVKLLIDAGQSNKAQAYIEIAIQTCGSIEKPGLRSYGFLRIAMMLKEIGQIDLALMCTSLSIQSCRPNIEIDAQIIALSMIIKCISNKDMLEQVDVCFSEAINLIELTSDIDSESWALWTICTALAETEHVDTAFYLAFSIANNEMCAEAISKALMLMNKMIDLNSIRREIVESFEIIFSIETKEVMETQIHILMDTLVRFMQIDVVMDIINSLHDRMKESALRVLINVLSKLDSIKDLEEEGIPLRSKPDNSEDTEKIQRFINTYKHIEAIENDEFRASQLQSIAAQVQCIPDTVITLDFLLVYWRNLPRRDEIIALLPAATPLIIAHPPLLQELLDGFAWVDQILKKW